MSRFTASDYIAILSCMFTGLTSILQLAGMYYLLALQIRNRKAGDPAIDVSQQIGDIKGQMAQVTNRLDTHAQLINENALSTPVIEDTHETKPPTVALSGGMSKPKVGSGS